MSEPIFTMEQMLKMRNENYAAGVADERERIIKLLEEHTHDISDAGSIQIWNSEEQKYGALMISAEDSAYLIALIKGENK